jgi:segregation and condensation protein B
MSENESKPDADINLDINLDLNIDSEIAADLGAASADVLDADLTDELSADLAADAVDSDNELSDFQSAEIEDVEELSAEQIVSVVESLLFASEKPQGIAALKTGFQGTKVRSSDIRAAIEKLQIEYSNPLRGVVIEEVVGGFQIRTKPENQKYLLRTVKARPFKLSGPALEVLSIVAYKQPCIKAAVDDIRGVESGHLMRGLLDRGLMHFAGKSELPGRPMMYETTRKFLEIFNLRNIQELPSLSEIDQLIPEGIGNVEEEKKHISDLTEPLSADSGDKTYSQGEEELLNISAELQDIETTTAFFEQEKLREKMKREAERVQDIQEMIAAGEEVDEKDRRWLAKHIAAQEAQLALAAKANAELQPSLPVENTSETQELIQNELTDDELELLDDNV